MAGMWVVQVAGDEIVHMIPVGNGFMTAAGSVDVAGVMTRTAMSRGARCRVLVTNLDDMLIKVVAVRRVQMAIVQVIHMVCMFHSGVATTGAMDMRMFGMNAMFAHSVFPFRVGGDERLTPVCEAGASLAWASALKTRSRMCWSARE